MEVVESSPWSLSEEEIGSGSEGERREEGQGVEGRDEKEWVGKGREGIEKDGKDKERRGTD